jgi:CheY-like chemotaxis protein
VRALGGTADLIITDIQMPKGDGLTFARFARELLPSIPSFSSQVISDLMTGSNL